VEALLPKPSTVTEKVLRLAHSPHTEHLLGVNEFFTRLAGHARLPDGCALRQWLPETITADACGGICGTTTDVSIEMTPPPAGRHFRDERPAGEGWRRIAALVGSHRTDL
jgi:hypothetical protein